MSITLPKNVCTCPQKAVPTIKYAILVCHLLLLGYTGYLSYLQHGWTITLLTDLPTMISQTYGGVFLYYPHSFLIILLYSFLAGAIIGAFSQGFLKALFTLLLYWGTHLLIFVCIELLFLGHTIDYYYYTDVMTELIFIVIAFVLPTILIGIISGYQTPQTDMLPINFTQS